MQAARSGLGGAEPDGDASGSTGSTAGRSRARLRPTHTVVPLAKTTSSGSDDGTQSTTSSVVPLWRRHDIPGGEDELTRGCGQLLVLAQHGYG